MAGIWLVAENIEQSRELLSLGKQLAADSGAELAVFTWTREWSNECLACGANQVLQLPELPSDQSIEAYVPLIADRAREDNPQAILIIATLKGREMAARIASRLNAGLISECQSLKWDGERKALIGERLIYGGSGVQQVCCLGSTQIATIPPRAYEAASRQGDVAGQIISLTAAPLSPVTLVEKKAREYQSRDITKARIIVCVGRGLEKKEDLEMARELAGLLGGEIGCTRPISEELHWMPEETCIGLSGKTVKPDLYIGLGVSGQIQHLTGIRDARIVCAINNDENAPIFAASDYGIVGDVYQVLPELIREIKNIKGN